MTRVTLETAHDLFEFSLQGMLAAEKRNLDVLEEATSEAKEPKLREALRHHRDETREQVRRIEEVFGTLGRKPRSVDASVVEGLVEEKRRFLNEDPTPEVIDLFLVAAAIKNEHMEIAAYETLLALADQTGARDAAGPLRENLEEEKAALEKLMKMATSGGLATSEKAAAPKGSPARR